ncbi:hypothetical protein U3516DRAFT_545661, partial [Neocallimastix sp. 'constans']
MIINYKYSLLFLSSILKATTALKTYNKCVNPGDFALVINNGLNLQTTNKILDILDKENIKATFFIDAQNENIISSDPLAKNIIEREYKNGHIISGQINAQEIVSNKELEKKINKFNDYIYNIIGVKPAFFRSPYAITNASTLDVLEKCNINANVVWNLYSERQYKNILNNNIDSIIALNQDLPSQATIINLLKLINHAKKLGYNFVTMDKCLELEPY